MLAVRLTLDDNTGIVEPSSNRFILELRVALRARGACSNL